MSETKHTPGPWEWEGGELLSDRFRVLEWTYSGIDAYNPADKTLIAAAPDLYAALKRLVDGINDEWHPLFNSPGPMSDDERKALEQAEAALAKAEGR